MIFNMNGGAGTLLNFNVLGGISAPANPKENTIFVKTNVEITSWVLSVDTPSSAEGMVWIPVTTSGSLKFNALKKNGVSVYLDNSRIVKQYVGGQWVSKTTLYYSNGEWTQLSDDWDGYYFKNGDQYTERTGGWVGSHDANSETSVGDTLYCWSNGWSAAFSNDAMVSTVKRVDLTNVKTLYATGNCVGYAIYMCVGKEKTNWVYTDLRVSPSNGTYTFDVSNLTGEYYIYFNGHGGQDGVAQAHISAVWGV